MSCWSWRYCPLKLQVPSMRTASRNVEMDICISSLSLPPPPPPPQAEERQKAILYRGDCGNREEVRWCTLHVSQCKYIRVDLPTPPNVDGSYRISLKDVYSLFRLFCLSSVKQEHCHLIFHYQTHINILWIQPYPLGISARNHPKSINTQYKGTCTIVHEHASQLLDFDGIGTVALTCKASMAWLYTVLNPTKAAGGVWWIWYTWLHALCAGLYFASTESIKIGQN